MDKIENEEIEELDDEDVEEETDVRLNLYWTCPKCKADNCEYDIPADGVVECKCEECLNTFTYYNCIY